MKHLSFPTSGRAPSVAAQLVVRRVARGIMVEVWFEGSMFICADCV